ncbi:MAG: tetratricopeptide repeat protein, partial [Acidobacteriota bacterium]
HDAKAYDLVRKALPLNGWQAAALLAPIRADTLALRDADLIKRSSEFVKRFGDSPSAGEVYLDWAGALHRRGDDAGALKTLQDGIANIKDRGMKLHASLEAARIAWFGLHDWDRCSRFLKVAETAAQGASDSASVLLENARLSWARGNGGDALGALADLVQKYPGTPAIPDAYLLLGRIRCAEGEREQGRKAYEVVLQSFPDSSDYPAAALAYAESLAAEGNLDGAAGSLAMVKGLPLPGEDGVKRDILLGELALKGGGYQSALPPLTQAVDTQIAPVERDRALFLLGEAHLASGNFQEARGAFLRIQGQTYRQAGLCRLAQALWTAKKQKVARAILERLIAAGGRPGSTALWILSSLDYTAGDEKSGSESLQKLVTLDPEDPLGVLAQRRLEMTLLTGKGPGAALMAIPDFLAAEPWNPEESVQILQQAQSRVRSGRYDEAASLYRKYLKRFPNAEGLTEAHLFLARRAMKRSDWRQASQELEAIPASPERNFLMGEVAYHMREMAAALKALQQVLLKPEGSGLDPSQVLRAEYLAGMAARIQSKTDEAVKYLSAYAAKAPANASQKDSLLNAALWLQREGALAPALEAFKRLNGAYRDAAIGFQYGYTLELMKKDQDA